jgi:hypothetical protein
MIDFSKLPSGIAGWHQSIRTDTRRSGVWVSRVKIHPSAAGGTATVPTLFLFHVIQDAGRIPLSMAAKNFRNLLKIGSIKNISQNLRSRLAGKESNQLNSCQHLDTASAYSDLEYINKPEDMVIPLM